MNRKNMALLGATLMSLGGGSAVLFAGSPASPYTQQTSSDRAAMKADGTKAAADSKDVKRLNELSAQANEKTRQARQAWLQKVDARKTAVKSFGPKDSRTGQAYKDEASAKQDYEARVKEQQEVNAQRKAAIEKLHGADVSDQKDVQKLEGDEKKHTTSPPKH